MVLIWSGAPVLDFMSLSCIRHTVVLPCTFVKWDALMPMVALSISVCLYIVGIYRPPVIESCSSI